MDNKETYLSALTAKDEEKALQAASYMVENADTELFKMLVEKSDFLFDFIRNNVCKRIEKVINKDNFINIIKFFDFYSQYYDDLFASILAKHANQDLTDDIFELLEKGTIAQKTYAAKYFYYIPDTVALEPLCKYAFSDDESLCYNAAEALGQMRDDISYDTALSYLNSDDDFDKLKAVKFFNAYGQRFPFTEIFKAMNSSKMPENIAGQIPYMESLMTLLYSKYHYETLQVIDNIIAGLGEILPLSDIFQFELYEVVDMLINKNKSDNEFSGKISEILLSAYSKFSMFSENQEYVFDEDKDTKYEISSVWKLLQAQNTEFWNKQKEFILKELAYKDNRAIYALHVISEFKIKSAEQKIKELLQTNDEILICEALTTLKSLQLLDGINIGEISVKIQNPNIKAIIENL